MTDMTSSDEAPARFLWLPPGLRPPVPMIWRQERVFLLVGAAAFFAGYDMNIFFLAAPQIQATFHIPENQIALTVAYFRVAAIGAMLICASADLVGRRRLLLVTMVGQAIATLATAFTANYDQFVAAQFVTRLFGYAEEMLCFVVVVEEMAAKARGWANGTMSAMDFTGAGVASLVFSAVNILPYGWRAIYVIGAVPLFLVAYLRRKLPETRRFATQESLIQAKSKTAETLGLLRGLVVEYPGRLLTILIAVSAWGFAISAATLLASKYLQSDYHYTPGDTTLLFVPGGLIGLALSIAAGRLSDRVGRKPMALAIVSLCAVCFYLYYGGAPAWAMPPLWILSFFGFFSGDVLVAGFALEIVPTRYRSTVSGLRYLLEIGMGAVALALEGRLYDHFHAHGPAIQLLLATIPITLIAILFLPEPAGKTLEEMAA
jgi:MFS family permease